MRFLPALVILLCWLGSAAAASEPLPPPPPATLADSDLQVVILPAPYGRACALLDLYNGSRDFPQATVPTVDEWRRASDHDGRRQAWAGSVTTFLEASGSAHEHVDADWRRFPLFTEQAERDPGTLQPTGRLLLYVPRHIVATEMQESLESLHQAAGYGAYPAYPRTRSHDLGELFVNGLGKIAAASGLAQMAPGNYAMILVGLLLFYLGIAKGFEPLLLVPIAMGCIFVNSIGAEMVAPPSPAGNDGGILYYFFNFGITTGIFPLLIFLGVGALTDFGPLLANPWSALLGGAAQFGIFGSFFLAAIFGDWFTLQQAGAIAIIGGADGPTSIYVAAQLAPELLGAIAVAAYSYMALVPIIQPPVMRALTNANERRIMMEQRKPVSKRAKIIFPVVVIMLCLLLLPSAVPLIGMLMFGNLLRESGVTDRLSKTAQNELINIVTIGLGLSVGTKLAADKFLTGETILILVLGVAAFVVGTAAGVIMAKIMNRMSGGRINPLIGSAGVSAVPMAARVSQVEGARYNRQNMLLMHAMGPNVAGVIGSAVAAGILLALLGD